MTYDELLGNSGDIALLCYYREGLFLPGSENGCSSQIFSWCIVSGNNLRFNLHDFLQNIQYEAFVCVILVNFQFFFFL